ncbi:MAG: hypothetical protein J1F05_03145 [Muribaculaceae bacterium]|nr:hypothetical protein [Muribaculaceae bacterium]
MNTTFFDKVGASVKSIVKIALQSRRSDACKGNRSGRIFILGNGPSLNDTIAGHRNLLIANTSMAVNFAAIAPVFFELQPEYYLLADPHFFSEATGHDDNLAKLKTSLSNVNWPMSLFVPVKYKNRAQTLYGNSHITLKSFNAVGVEGFFGLRKFAYNNGFGMPRPRNVLIPAIMLSIGEGFDEIIICGADHSWTKTLSVSDDNEVVSIQPHFYADSNRENERIRHEYKGYKLHQIMESFSIAFKSYHDIAEYAKTKNVKIFNATPGSFIDAFDRIKL